MTSYRVTFGVAAAKAYAKSPPEVKGRIRMALESLARNVSAGGRIKGKATKTLRGTDDTFHRLRVGEYRVMDDVLHEDHVVLVLGIVHRSDLERWISRR